MTCTEAEFKSICEKAFDETDTDKSGHLDCDELFQVFNKVCKEKKATKSPDEIKKDCEAMIAELDKNRDKKVSKQEFMDYMINLFKKFKCT